MEHLWLTRLSSSLNKLSSKTLCITSIGDVMKKWQDFIEERNHCDPAFSGAVSSSPIWTSEVEIGNWYSDQMLIQDGLVNHVQIDI
jgi:hypothetical protein